MKKFEKVERPLCDCGNLCMKSPSSVSGFNKKCRGCYKKAQANKLGISVQELSNKSHPYRKFRKTYCENVDSRLGFRCTTTILLSAQLEVDHIDGNPSNNDPKNLQTLCSCCHKYKTILNEDYKTPGRKELGIKY